MTWFLILLMVFSPIIKESEIKMSDKQKKIKSFLKNISQVESRGGEDTEHKLIQKGIHKGHKAIGRYGLMPNTVSEVINRMRINGKMTPELEQLKMLSPEDIKTKLESNPALEDQIAEALGERVLDRQQDEDKAAYSWNQGHNLSPEKISTKPYKEHDYVKKYNIYKKLSTDIGEDNE